MCLLAFSLDNHPRYRFVLAGNRDEFHARPTAEAHWWEDAPTVFGGRDLEAGGAWLGLRTDGRFAVLTNFRDVDLKQPDAPSRGELVREFLATDMRVSDMHEWLRSDGSGYAGFNIIYGHLASAQESTVSLWYFSNAAGDRLVHPIEPGIHGLSNHLLNTPWPKVRRTVSRMEEMVYRDTVDHPELLAMLDDPQPAEDGELPDTGIPLEWEKRLSAPKIISDRYGTRASTTLLVDRHGVASLHERSFNAEGEIQGETGARFELQMPSGNMGA